MKEKDMERKQNEQLNDLEEEEREKSDHLRAKAIFMLQEQEDEIKHLNEVSQTPQRGESNTSTR